MKKMMTILTVIALLAMGFTVATHKSGTGNTSKNPAQVFVCQTDLGRNLYFSAYTSCLSGMQKTRGVSPCAPPGHNNFDCAKLLTQNPIGTPCPGGQYFCCAVRDTLVCPAGCISVRVYCMP